MSVRKVVSMTVTDTVKRDIILAAGFPKPKDCLFGKAVKKLLKEGVNLNIVSTGGKRYQTSVSIPISLYNDLNDSTVDTVSGEMMRRIGYTLLRKNKRNPNHVSTFIDSRYYDQLCELGGGDINEGLKLLLG